MKVVIVGCGWLGGLLARELTDNGYQVFGSRRSEEGLAQLPEQVIPLQLDLSAKSASSTVYRALEQAWVICAIPPALRRGGSENYTAALTQLAQLMRQAGSYGLIHLSSSGIYQGLSGEVDETANLQMHSERVATLLQGENILQQMTSLCITLRLGGLIGPGRHPGRFVAGKVLANPDGLINMIHANDVCRAVQLLLACDQLQSATYNLSSPAAVTRQQFYQAACKTLASEVGFSNDSVISHRAVPEHFMQRFGFTYRFYNAIDALVYCN